MYDSENARQRSSSCVLKCWLGIGYSNTGRRRRHHGLRDSGSTVVMMTLKVNEKVKFWPPVDLKSLKLLNQNQTQ